MSNLIHITNKPRILTTLLVCLITFTVGTSKADDTEIYFSSQIDVGESQRPNLLFMLDTSGSMGRASATPGLSRLNALKDAMTNILTDVEGVNVGLMRFNNEDGGPILFPITYIDAAANTVAGEDDDSRQSFSYSIENGSDDAIEVRSNNDGGTAAANLPAGVAVGDVDSAVTQAYLVNSPDISSVPTITGGSSGTYQQIITTGNNDINEYFGFINRFNTDLWFYASGNTHSGLRFTSLNIPVNAKIDNATLRLTTRFQYNNTHEANVYAIDADNVPNPFSSFGRTFELSTATLTSARVPWSVSAVNGNQTVNSPNLSSVIQEIVSNGCATVGDGSTAGCTWSTNNNIALIIKEGTGSKRFYGSDTTTNNSFRPRLTIDWSIPGTASGGTTAQEGLNHMTGLRFDGVAIPQGATITSARLRVSSSQDNQSDATNWNISAENVGDSPTFDINSNNLSSRTKTSSINWSLPTSNEWQYETDINGDITSITTEESPDLSSIVQTVVNRSDWCGGNAISFFIDGNDFSNGREIFHQESGNGNEAKLVIEYDRASGNGGCIIRRNSDEVASSRSDAEETTSSGNMRTDRQQLRLQPGNDVGLRFGEVDVPQGVTITEAFIRFTADDVNTNATNITISVENADNVNEYSTNNSDITDRTYAATTANWVPEDWDSNDSSYFSSDIKDLVQLIVNRGGWTSGNSMGFKISTTSGLRRAKSFNHGDGITDAARLIITYEGTASSAVKTVRERLIEIVNELPASGNTPLTEVLLEAANYWTGDDVQYGDRRRQAISSNRISHPGSYCRKDATTGTVDCGAANTAGYPEFGVEEPFNCSAGNLDSAFCSNRRIRSNSGQTLKYISPFTENQQCSGNYQIMLSDGTANSLDLLGINRIRSQYLNNASCDTVRPDGTLVNFSELCSLDLAEHMFNNDLSTTLGDDQTVITNTIGFNTSNAADAFLRNLASIGGGEFREANSASELANVFSEIFSDVRRDPTSFAAPSLSTNAFNSLFSRDEIYFGLFNPSEGTRWDGNVKKFRVCDNTTEANCDVIGRLLDANGTPALNANNRFDDNAQSFWSAAADGANTTQGGAGAELDDFNDRIIYTEAGTILGTPPALGTLLNGALHQLTASNWNSSNLAHVRNLVCPVPSTNINSECAEIMLWLLGRISDPNDETDITATTRWTMGDVLHSSPVVITYGGEDVEPDGVIDTFYDKLIFGTNSGALHFVNGSNDNNGGQEEWAFFPEASLQQQETLFSNNEGDHTYAMDLTPIIRRCDGDGDGIIEPDDTASGCDANNDGTPDGDYVHVIAGMRRGGNNIYALDITGSITSTADTVIPRFLWRIDGGIANTDFQNLSNTWSQPTLATIQTANGFQEVLIFGGGYDTVNDATFGVNGSASPTGNTNDNNGNMIFIVDPIDGSLIFSIGGSDTNATIKVPDMHFSIPGKISRLDSDRDGDTDRIYVGDTGGQVWRIDLANDIDPTSGTAPQGSSVVGRLAAISEGGGNPAINARRFIERPAVVQILDTEFSTVSEYDYVVIGTGNRANPLDEDTEDYLFAFRDYTVGEMDAATGSNLAVNYPGAGGAPITPADMVDASNAVLDADASQVQSGSGWYINFSTVTDSSGNVTDGEKILSEAVVFSGNAFFTTYIPGLDVAGATSANTDSCTANVGGGFLYGVNLLSAEGFFTEDGASGTDARKQGANVISGIGSAPIPFFTEEGVNLLVGSEGGLLPPTGSVSGGGINREYWYEY